MIYLNLMHFIRHVDDNYLCLSHNNPDHLQWRVNTELVKVDNWLPNKLSLCSSKSTFILKKSLNNNSKLSESCLFQTKINDSYSFIRMTCAKYLVSDRQLMRVLVSHAIYKMYS